MARCDARFKRSYPKLTVFFSSLSLDISTPRQNFTIVLCLHLLPFLIPRRILFRNTTLWIVVDIFDSSLLLHLCAVCPYRAFQFSSDQISNYLVDDIFQQIFYAVPTFWFKGSPVSLVPFHIRYCVPLLRRVWLGSDPWERFAIAHHRFGYNYFGYQSGLIIPGIASSEKKCGIPMLLVEIKMTH